MSIKVGPTDEISKKNRLTVTIVFLFLIIGGSGLGIYFYRYSNPNKQQSSAASNATVNVGVVVNSSKSYSIDEVSQTYRETVNVSITNNGVSVIQISPGLQMQLLASNGQSYPYTAQYITPGQVAGGPLQPGQTWSQPVDFVLPAGTNPTTFEYQVVGNSVPIEVNL
jgi:hypothetical protein